MTQLNYRAFYNCPALRSITLFSEEVPAVGTEPFYSYNATLYVPAGSVELYKADKTWSKFNSIEPITEPVYLTIKQAEGGCVKIPVSAGSKHTLTIIVENGWALNTVLYNDVDVTKQLVGNTYATPAITSDALLSVSYEQTTGVKENSFNSSEVKVFAQGNSIVVRGVEAGESIRVYTVDGKCAGITVAGGNEARFNVPNSGTYIVKTNEKTVKLAM